MLTQPQWMQIPRGREQPSDFELGNPWWRVADGTLEHVTLGQRWEMGSGWLGALGGAGGRGKRDAYLSHMTAGFLTRGQTPSLDSQASFYILWQEERRGHGLCAPSRVKG